MNEKLKIISEIQNRNIEYFVHFTDARNLPSILANGLLTKSSLDWYEIDYSYNDEERIDNMEDSISLSVSFPNYKMFYPTTLKYPKRDWCVLFLNALDVIKYDCAYNFTNAASNSCRFIPIDERKKFSSFQSMFQENVNGHIRSTLNLFDYETTDPQAELLVLEDLPPSCIEFAFFKTPYLYRQYCNIFQDTGVQCWYNSGYFYGRHDYEYWR